jgi:transposase
MGYIKRSKKNGKVYLSEVETKRIEGKVVTRHLRYIGKEVDGETVVSSSLSNVEVDEVKIYGPLLVLNHLAQEIGLSSVLGHYGDEILSMVYAHCLDYESVNQMPSWYERTDLNMLLDLEGLTEERLLKALDSLEAQDPTQLQKKIFDRMQSRYELNTTGIVYDVTNTYLYGKKCPFGKPGKDKEGVKGRPLIQIGLGVTQDEGVPVFHKIFHGNIHDSRTLQDLLTTFRAFGLRSGLMIFDRGISSKKNQLDIRDLNWKVLCGLPLDRGLKRSCMISLARVIF